MPEEQKQDFEPWRVALQRRDAEVGPLVARALAFVEHAVSYGQAMLRTILELNGGGLIALPSFGAMAGSIWSRGPIWPYVAGSVFVAGLVFAAIGYGCAFFSFMMGQGNIWEEVARRSAVLNAEYFADLNGQPRPPRNEERTTKEAQYLRRAQRFQIWAIVAAIFALLLFIGGAIITGYILTGVPHQPK